jgi:outer membrane protein OmpA-like peptidoglycan-associated protein
MYRRATAALLMLGVIGGTAAAQTPNAPGQPGTIRTEQVPVFRVTVVGRTTPAINYRPRRGATKVDFVGTALMPRARGEAKVEGKRGYMELDVRVDELEPAARFGPEYLTYVLWAITPEGRAKNLGEIQIDDDDDTLDVTTDLQAFGLIVTAEPYFAVTQPSDVVVMENVVRDETEGRVEPIQAKYELLKRGTYLMQHEASDLKVKSLEPGAPLDLAQARNAVMLARFAGADRYAADTFGKALALLRQAEEARERRSRGNTVMMPARQAVQTAEDARLIALQKQEEAYVAEQRALASERETAALERARAEETARRHADMSKAAEEARRKQAERDTETLRREAELEKQALRRQSELELDALRKQAELEKEAVRRQAELDQLNEANAKLAAERERAAADAARSAAETEAARQSAEARAREAQEAAAQAEREKSELRERLREQLNVILETRETARGLVVNLSDVLFDTGSANLKPGAREKLARIAGVVLSHPGLQVQIEGHTDSVGSEGYNQQLSERRADSVRTYLVRQGISAGAVGTAGYGESQPVVSNNTSAGRQQNRRVELVISGEALGTKTTASLRRDRER